MQRIVRKVSDDIVQITVADERWYVREIKKRGKVQDHEFVPSVTWITGFYPKGPAFYKWLGNKGYDEAEAIKIAAGEKGTKVHTAIGQLLETGAVDMTDMFVNPTSGIAEPLSVDEYEAIWSFREWFKATMPTVDAVEMTLWNEKYGYAGTADLILWIEGEPWIIDIKTSQSWKPEWELQVSAYAHCVSFQKKQPRLAILQVGYQRNKQKFKFTEVDDKFPLFLATRDIWKNETEGHSPRRLDLPVRLTMDGKRREPVTTTVRQVLAGKKITKPKQ